MIYHYHTISSHYTWNRIHQIVWVLYLSNINNWFYYMTLNLCINFYFTLHEIKFMYKLMYISPYTLTIKWLRENLLSYKQRNLLHKYHDHKNKLLSYKIITIKWLRENLLSYKQTTISYTNIMTLWINCYPIK